MNRTDPMNSLRDARKAKGHTALVVLVASGLTLATLALVAVMACSSYRSTLDAARQNARFISSLVAGQMGMVLVDIENSLNEMARLVALMQHLPRAEKTNDCAKPLPPSSAKNRTSRPCSSPMPKAGS